MTPKTGSSGSAASSASAAQVFTQASPAAIVNPTTGRNTSRRLTCRALREPGGQVAATGGVQPGDRLQQRDDDEVRAVDAHRQRVVQVLGGQ